LSGCVRHLRNDHLIYPAKNFDENVRKFEEQKKSAPMDAFVHGAAEYGKQSTAYRQKRKAVVEWVYKTGRPLSIVDDGTE
jgi:hypothetical protein